MKTTPLDAHIASLAAELLGFLRRRAPSEAEELAQETWLRVARANPDCADRRALRAFAYTVARRLLVDRYRRRARRGPLMALEGGLAASSGDPHASLCAGRALALVERTLNTMKREQAEVFRWRLSTELSFREIAARQGVSVNTALGRHHAATKKIGRALREAGLLEAS